MYTTKYHREVMIEESRKYISLGIPFPNVSSNTNFKVTSHSMEVVSSTTATLTAHWKQSQLFLRMSAKKFSWKHI